MRARQVAAAGLAVAVTIGGAVYFGQKTAEGPQQPQLTRAECAKLAAEVKKEQDKPTKDGTAVEESVLIPPECVGEFLKAGLSGE